MPLLLAAKVERHSGVRLDVQLFGTSVPLREQAKLLISLKREWRLSVDETDNYVSAAAL